MSSAFGYYDWLKKLYPHYEWSCFLLWAVSDSVYDQLTSVLTFYCCNHPAIYLSTCRNPTLFKNYNVVKLKEHRPDIIEIGCSACLRGIPDQLLLPVLTILTFETFWPEIILEHLSNTLFITSPLCSLFMLRDFRLSTAPRLWSSTKFTNTLLTSVLGPPPQFSRVAFDHLLFALDWFLFLVVAISLLFLGHSVFTLS